MYNMYTDNNVERKLEILKFEFDEAQFLTILVYEKTIDKSFS